MVGRNGQAVRDLASAVASARSPVLFEQASYSPIDAAGVRADHICAFVRGNAATRMLTVASADRRLLADGQAWPLGERSWADTKLMVPAADGRDKWIDLFTGRL